MASRISLIIQEGVLRSYFPDSIIKRNGEREIAWIHKIKPSALSAEYVLLLHHKTGDSPKVYVVDPTPLKLAEGKKLLPHVYSTPKQQLCLYFPTDREWLNTMLYAKTLIPWASEWLIHYELWAETGVWCGGGIEHDENLEENKFYN